MCAVPSGLGCWNYKRVLYIMFYGSESFKVKSFSSRHNFGFLNLWPWTIQTSRESIFYLIPSDIKVSPFSLIINHVLYRVFKSWLFALKFLELLKLCLHCIHYQETALFPGEIQFCYCTYLEIFRKVILLDFCFYIIFKTYQTWNDNETTVLALITKNPIILNKDLIITSFDSDIQ